MAFWFVLGLVLGALIILFGVARLKSGVLRIYVSREDGIFMAPEFTKSIETLSQMKCVLMDVDIQHIDTQR